MTNEKFDKLIYFIVWVGLHLFVTLVLMIPILNIYIANKLFGTEELTNEK